MRESGYIVTAKFFIPSPKDSFAKQAAAATLMASIEDAKALTPEFIELAQMTDFSAKMGTRDAPDLPLI